MYNDKAALIKSMNNLLKHITSSRQAQQEIFNSLQKKDLDKIVSNLTDPVLQLRLTSARLIGQLLLQNEILQSRFCQIMNIHFCQHTEIIVNSNFDKIIESYPHRAKQIFNLLKNLNKSNINQHKTDALIWFINPQKDMLSVQYLSEQQIGNLIKLYHVNQNPQEVYFDPIYCIFGVFLRENKIQNQKYRSTQTNSLNDSVKYSEKSQPSYFQPYVPRVQKVFNYPQVTANINLIPSKRIQNGLLEWGTPIKKDRNIIQYPTAEQKAQNYLKSPRKISLTQNRRKSHVEQPACNKNGNQIIIPQVSKSNNSTDRNFITIKQKVKQDQSKSFNFNQFCPPQAPQFNSIHCSFTAKNTYNPYFSNNQQLGRKQDEGNESYSLVAPSLKVKSIAMNGRQGWQTTRNLKLQTPVHQHQHQQQQQVNL